MKTTSRILAAIAALTGIVSVVACGAPPDGGESTRSSSEAMMCETCGTGGGTSGGGTSSGGSIPKPDPFVFPATPVCDAPTDTCNFTEVSATSPFPGASCDAAYQFNEYDSSGNTLFSYYVTYCANSAQLQTDISEDQKVCAGDTVNYDPAFANASTTQRTLPTAAAGYTYVRWTVEVCVQDCSNPDGCASSSGGSGGHCSSGCSDAY
jgi:hypothetical protein